MSFEIQQQYFNDEDTVTFIFDDTVYQQVVGINYFKFCYEKGKDHEIQDMSIHLEVNRVSVNGGIDNAITVKAIKQFNNDDNNQYDTDPSMSSLTVTCLALVGDNNTANCSLTNVSNIPAAGSTPIPGSIPNNSNLFAAVLSGFDFSYGTDDYKVRKCTAGVGVNKTNLTGDATMEDDSGNKATCSLDAGLIAYENVSGSNLLWKTVDNVNTSDDIVIPFEQPITGAAVFLSSWSLSFSDNKAYKVYEIAIGIGGSTLIDKDEGTVTIQEPISWIYDHNEKHCQDNDSSNISFYVVATV